MIKKIIFPLILLSNILYGLSVGDKINSEIQNKLNLQDNKVYIIDFFAAWCVSCKIELPLISQINTRIDKSKYKIIGVNVDEDINTGRNFVKELDLNFPIVYDPQNKIISAFAPIGIPAIYFIKDLEVKQVIFGAVHSIDEKILNTLDEIK